jgi:two-component system LytT family response regulator
MRALVVDDESPARKKILRLLAPHADVEVVGEAACGEEAVTAIESAAADVVFLDVQMPDMDGFEVLRRVRAPSTFFPVFITAYDAFAVKAFEVNALDYLLKPVDPRRFDAMLDRARAAVGAGSRAKRLLVADRQRTYFVEAARVDWIESDRNYVVLHAGGAEHVVRGTLEAYAKGLDPEVFVRINRSQVINREAVVEIRPWTHGERQVVLRDGAVLTWTRRFREPG